MTYWSFINSEISKIVHASFIPEKTFVVIDNICRLIENSVHDNVEKADIFSILAVITQARSITDVCSIVLSRVIDWFRTLNISSKCKISIGKTCSLDQCCSSWYKIIDGCCYIGQEEHQPHLIFIL